MRQENIIGKKPVAESTDVPRFAFSERALSALSWGQV